MKTSGQQQQTRVECSSNLIEISVDRHLGDQEVSTKAVLLSFVCVLLQTCVQACMDADADADADARYAKTWYYVATKHDQHARHSAKLRVYLHASPNDATSSCNAMM